MDKVFCEKWCDALESGEYKQGVGYLHTITSDDCHQFCCLGVACKLLGLEGEKTEGNIISYEGLVSTLSVETRKSIGMDQGLMFTLSLMNDSGKTFKEIASYLRNLEEYVGGR